MRRRKKSQKIILQENVVGWFDLLAAIQSVRNKLLTAEEEPGSISVSGNVTLILRESNYHLNIEIGS